MMNFVPLAPHNHEVFVPHNHEVFESRRIVDLCVSLGLVQFGTLPNGFQVIMLRQWAVPWINLDMRPLGTPLLKAVQGVEFNALQFYSPGGYEECLFLLALCESFTDEAAVLAYCIGTDQSISWKDSWLSLVKIINDPESHVSPEKREKCLRTLEMSTGVLR